MSQKRWKKQEERVGRLFGLHRNPHNGSGKADVEGKYLLIENKDRRRLPAWLLSEVLKARQKRKSHQLPIVTLTSQTERDILVVMHMKDFRDWFGDEK